MWSKLQAEELTLNSPSPAAPPGMLSALEGGGNERALKPSSGVFT